VRQRGSSFAAAPFVDTLFSAAELAARAHLLGIPDREFTRKGTHKSIQIRFNKWANIGNAKPPHRDVLNTLAAFATVFVTFVRRWRWTDAKHATCCERLKI